MDSLLKTSSLNVNVKTNNPTGYSLSFSDSDEDTRLLSLDPANTAHFSSITSNMPTASFTDNTWGYSLDNSSFKPIPKKSAAEIIKATNAATIPSGEDTAIHIGVKADSSIPADTYQDTLEISVVTNHVPRYATFLPGPQFNTHFKNIVTANPFSEMWFKKATSAPANLTSAIVVSTADSDVPIYMWINTNDKTVYWWSEADIAYLNRDSTTMFGIKDQTYGQMNLDLRGMNASRAKNMGFMFGVATGFENNIKTVDMSDFETTVLEKTDFMFNRVARITSLNLSNLDTQHVITMRSMFANTTGLTDLNISNLNTSSVTNMSNMFYNSKVTSLDFSSFDTSKVTVMNGMFEMTPNLTSLNLANFDTSQVTNMANMFSSTALTTLNLANFDTRNVTDMSKMFQHSRGLTELNLSNFNTSRVTNMSYMFYWMSNLQTLDLSGFNTTNVTKFDSMFSTARRLATIKVANSFNSSSMVTDVNVFNDNRALVGGNGTAYSATNPSGVEYARIDQAGQPGYFTAI